MAPRILHVEDDPDIRIIALLALETVGGLEVVQCSSGREALEHAPQIGPDLFLLDSLMPGMNGEETLRTLRRMPQFAATPAIFMTGKAEADEVARLRGCGAEVIVKPFDPMTLADQIREIWARTN